MALRSAPIRRTGTKLDLGSKLVDLSIVSLYISENFKPDQITWFGLYRTIPAWAGSVRAWKIVRPSKPIEIVLNWAVRHGSGLNRVAQPDSVQAGAIWHMEGGLRRLRVREPLVSPLRSRFPIHSILVKENERKTWKKYILKVHRPIIFSLFPLFF